MILYKDEVYRIQGAVFEVYRELGSGFLEAVYQEALEKELSQAGVPFEAQKRLAIEYKGIPLQQLYIADIVCYGKIILELKAVKKLDDNHLAQMLNYLKATGFKLGLLINFGTLNKAECKRVILDR